MGGEPTQRALIRDTLHRTMLLIQERALERAVSDLLDKPPLLTGA